MTLTKQDIKEIGESILMDRIESLKNEARHCIYLNEETKEMMAPFSALLYCFSTIDLLGSLYTGKFNEREDTKNVKLYMKEMMSYSDLQITLLQNIFRHKLVHSAEPKWLHKNNDEIYTWSCYRDNRKKHLECIELDKEAHANNFSISIWSFVEDIVDSVNKDDGYLNKLLKDKIFFENFKKALDGIMDEN